MRNIKKYIVKLFMKITNKLYGTGIGNYFPIKQVYKFYTHFVRNTKISIDTIYNFKIYVYGSDDIIGRSLFSKGYWEKPVSDLIVKHLKEGDIFLDVGANIGYDSLLAAKIVGNKGKVLAFEPSQKNYIKMLENIELNNFTNITSYKLGVGDKDYEDEIMYNEHNPGKTSLVKMTENKNFEKELIKIVKLDDFVTNTKIDFVKIDTEGFEFEAIKGMNNILQSNENLKLIFEWSPYFYKSKTKNYKKYSISILEYLEKLGYTLYKVGQNNIEIIIDFEKYYTNNSIQSDILGIKNEK